MIRALLARIMAFSYDLRVASQPETQANTKTNDQISKEQSCQPVHNLLVGCQAHDVV